jgi:hypothetical protein
MEMKPISFCYSTSEGCTRRRVRGDAYGGPNEINSLWNKKVLQKSPSKRAPSPLCSLIFPPKFELTVHFGGNHEKESCYSG